MPGIPQDPYPDSSLSLVRHGYQFISRKCRRYQSDLFQTRLLGKEVVCIHGEEASRLFYDQDYFVRKGAVPGFIQKSLFGVGGVQSMDDAAHQHRKKAFMSLMNPQSIERLLELTAAYWQAYIQKWEQSEELVVLFEEAQEIQCRAICAWAGMPLKEQDVRPRTDDLMGRIDSFGTIGPRYLRGRWARTRTDRWYRSVIEKVRSGEMEVEEGTAAHVMATFRDLDGKLLDVRTAAVELNNATRPFVAVAYFITFAALALHKYPEYRQKLREGDNEEVEMFVQEVRRLYPFVPFLGARVRKPFDWKGHSFEEGHLVILDVYGTLHDERIWENPDEFRPERFREWNGDPFNFMPQGGGNFEHNHRCAGEWITIGSLKVALQFLVNLEYEVPKQDFGFSLSRMPAYPRSGFTIRNVKRVVSSPGGALSGKKDAVITKPPVADRQTCPYHRKKESTATKEE